MNGNWTRSETAASKTLIIVVGMLMAGMLFNASPAAAQPAAERPNFVLIFIDDMGYGDIEPFGSKRNDTPNLNRMAAEGLKLTSFYAAPVCSASRAQLMTGCYAPRVSVPGVFFPAGRHGLNPDEHTIADYLGEAGYATACIGKWHLGDQRQFLPTSNGFDHYFGIPYSNDMARKSSDDGRMVHPLMRDTKVEELLENEDQRLITRRYTTEAVRFIQDNQERPFFLYLPHTAMHVPLYPHPEYVGSSKNGVYGDWVREVDWSVGEILKQLRLLKLERKTLVLFTSDNGPWASKGEAGGVSGPLRGSKGCTLEGGVREPTIAWWPDQIAAGSASDAIAGTTDVLPTFASLAGVPLRKDRVIDGVDISDLLLGNSETAREDWFYFKGTRLTAVRRGPWKLALSPQSLGMGIREKPEDLARPGRLYNLDEEIGETTDLSQDHAGLVNELTQLAIAKATEIGEGARPPGVAESPVTLFPSEAKKRRPGKSAAAVMKPIRWDEVRAGQVYASAVAPKIAGRSFEIQAHVVLDSDSQGVIVAHGGSAVGYCLYVTDQWIGFTLRSGAGEINRVQLELPPPNLELSIIATALADGSISLSAGRGKVQAESRGQINRHPQEDLCIGHDDKNPVDPQAPGGKFVGKIRNIKIEIQK